MKYYKHDLIQYHTYARLCEYSNTTGANEIHAMLHIDDVMQSVSSQFQSISQAAKEIAKLSQTRELQLIWARYFVSDAINQQSFIDMQIAPAVSLVEQPPLDGTKVALWLYFAPKSTVEKNDATVVYTRPHYTHLFTTQMHSCASGEYAQTDEIFNDYDAALARYNTTLADNVIRTWIYVQGVDLHYAGMVEARKAHFDRCHLTSQTHYISSTGIEGRYINPQNLVMMDGYAVSGLKSEQITFLHAPTHLSTTYKYGVTFERGTAVAYGDRTHFFISGTASIDSEGEIVHPLDVCMQLERTLENIQVLLSKEQASFDHLAHLIVYLRDMGDYKQIQEAISIKLPHVPTVILLAPVCRPGWLIEIECMAIRDNSASHFNLF